LIFIFLSESLTTKVPEDKFHV